MKDTLEPMKSNPLVCLILFLISTSPLLAAPSFWGGQEETPTPSTLMPVEEVVATPTISGPTATPVVIQNVSFPTPTPTPLPGMKSKDATTAAILSTVLPGLGQVYDEDPLRGVAFAALFGVGLWQTIDNLQLVNASNPAGGNKEVKNEDAGELIGLGTLAVYGFCIQDAANSANNYNRHNNLALTFQLKPRSGAQLALRF